MRGGARRAWVDLAKAASSGHGFWRQPRGAHAPDRRAARAKVLDTGCGSGGRSDRHQGCVSAAGSARGTSLETSWMHSSGRSKRPSSALRPSGSIWIRILLAATDPALEVASIHDAKHQDHAVGIDHVIHHTIVAHPETVERVACATNGLHSLAADATLLRCLTRQLVQSAPEPVAGLEWQLPECSGRRRREPDLIGGQTRSLRPTVRPFA